MLRLFVGIAIPESLTRRLSALQGGIPDARWMTPDSFHVTLSFIGDVDEGAAEDIDEALRSIHAESFDMKVAGVGCFSQGDTPLVLWAGVEKDERLMRSRDKVSHALVRARIEHDARKYTPHITLARFRHAPPLDKLADFMEANSGFSAEPFTVGEFILYRSHLGKSGSVYEELARYPLAV